MEFQKEHLSDLDPAAKRQVLIEALSYIQDFAGKIVVIKYGGAAMVQEAYKVSFARDIVLLRSLGMLPVLSAVITEGIHPLRTKMSASRRFMGAEPVDTGGKV